MNKLERSFWSVLFICKISYFSQIFRLEEFFLSEIRAKAVGKYINSYALAR